jgi:hypothetical protein
MGNRIIYQFWTGSNPLSANRHRCLDQLRRVSGCETTLITPMNLAQYILPDHPLHAAYPYLSETHKADYLRTYFMHFHGGGYCDIKETTGEWTAAFDALERNEDMWICGYTEIDGGVAYIPHRHLFTDLIGNCCYICKPRTPLTKEWFTEMTELLDKKLDRLMQFPATFPQDCAEHSDYPVEWNEMLGRIFHRITYRYKDRMLHALPPLVFWNYR